MTQACSGIDRNNELKACLSQVYSIDTEIDSVENVSRTQFQLKVVTVEKEVFGFKVWDRINESVDGSASDCEERNRLMTRMAQLVSAPNVCEVRSTKSLNCIKFAGNVVAVSKWLPESISLERMKAGERTEIERDGNCFFRQYGQWLAFGAAMDFRDWTPNNFVWSHKNQTLAMIDMDWSLGRGQVGSSRNSQPLQTFAPINSALLIEYLAQLSSGIKIMQDKLEEKKTILEKLLKGAEQLQIQGFGINIDERLATAATQEIRTLLLPSES